MGRYLISKNEVSIWKALKENGGWISTAKLHELTGVSLIVVRKKTTQMASLGLLESVRSHPSISFRVKPDLPADHPRVVEIERVAEALRATSV